MRGPKNIRELTRDVARDRGSDSKVTVRKRTRRLLKLDIIERAERFNYGLLE